MKIVYYNHNNSNKYGVIKDSQVYEIEGDIYSDFNVSETSIDVNDITPLPFSKPGKLICVGLNYLNHAKEANMEVPSDPMIFMCSPSSIIGNEDYIKLDSYSDNIEFEAELAVIMGKECKNVKKEDYKKYILGYSCSNDVSNRNLQAKDRQFTRAKSYDTYKPIGPYIVTGINPDELKITLIQNGEIKQNSNTSDMIFSVGDIIEFLSHVMTLDPGDIILTGTPAGVNKLNKEDKIEIEIENIGTLVNYVK